MNMTLRKNQAGIAASLAMTGVAAAVLAGCSPGSTGTASTSASATSAAAPTVTVTVTASAGASSAITPPAGSSSAPPAASSPVGSAPGRTAGTPACSAASVQVSLGSAVGTAGSVYQYIEFKNVSATACTMYGFPGVSLRGGTPPSQIGAAATRAPNDNPSLVTLPPGGWAAAAMRLIDAGAYSDSTCRPKASATLRVYPPNQTVPQDVPYASTGCAASSVQLLQINAVQPGTGNPPGAS
jgi:hypothetical protein